MRRPARTPHSGAPRAPLAASLFVALLAAGSAACSGGRDATPGTDDDPAPARAPADGAEGEPATPPFAVRGDLAGLLIVWYDAEGLHPARTREEVPEAHRDEVRVDSLALPPDQRLDPAYVYVADLRAPRPDGTYAVRKLARDTFEARVAAAAARAAALATATQAAATQAGATQAGPAQADGAIDPAGAAGTGPAGGPGEPGASGDPGAAPVVVYGASWCGACRQAKQFLAARGVPFVERDVEREPGAHAEMMQKARAQGLSPTGIPVIDVRGRILLGFDPGALARALAQPPAATAPGRPL
jgi:glutaredoxin